MMNSRVSNFTVKFREVFNNYYKFTFFSRGIEFQKRATTELENILKELVELKNDMIQIKDEESANIMLSLEYFLKTLIDDFNMLISLKEDHMDMAWTSLINAQMNLRSACQASTIVDNFNAEAYVQKLFLYEKLLFPPQKFFSIGGKVTKSLCSICNQEYGKCEHVKGRPYMGKLCFREIKGMELQETSLVDDPGNKHCRIITFSDNGKMRDLLTWRISNGVTQGAH